MWWIGAIGTALAADCPPTVSGVEAAWSAFEDAEVEEANRVLDETVEQLGCQAEVVDVDDLVRLYHLDAMVALSLGDRDAAQIAVIRSVVVDPERAPDAVMGPELASLHTLWSGRLASNRSAVVLVDEGEAWLDGRRLTAGERTLVVQGAHLLQLEQDAGLKSEVVEITADLEVVTGIGSPLTVAEAAPAPQPLEPEKRKPRRRRRRAVTLTLGGLGLAGGAAAVGLGTWLENQFQANLYDAPSYNGCEQGSSCWSVEREALIRRDAGRVRLLYGAGYGLLGVGAATISLELFVLPRPTGAALGVAGRW